MTRKIASTNWFDAGEPTPRVEALDPTPPPAPGEELRDPTPSDAISPAPPSGDADAMPSLAAATVSVVAAPPPPPPPPPLLSDVPAPPAREPRSKRKPRMAAPAVATEAATEAAATATPVAVPEISRAHRDHPETRTPAKARTDRPRTAKAATPTRPKKPASKQRRIASLAITALLIGAWSVTLRPTWMGGPASVLTVRGISMEPTYQYGDIVIAHQSSDYEVDDVVAFRVPEGDIGAGTVVIHRIIGGDATAGFITQGDNNPDPDEWRPVPTDILGVARFHIPAIGKLVGLLRTVPGIALLAGLLAALLVHFGTAGSHERRPRAGRRAERVESEPPVCPEVDLEPVPVVIAELTLEVAADRVAIEPIPGDAPFEHFIIPPPLPAEPSIPIADPLEDLISLPPCEPTALDTTLSPMPAARRATEDDTEAPIVGEYWGDLEHLAAILRERTRPDAEFDDELEDELDDVARPAI